MQRRRGLPSRLSRAIGRAFKRHPRILYPGLLTAVVALVALQSVLLGGTQPAPTQAQAGPTYTYDGTWTLLELQRHIESGEVAAISVTPAGTRAVSGRPGADGQSGSAGAGGTAAEPGSAGSSGTTAGVGSPSEETLLARTRDGQQIRVLLTSSAGDAAAALNALGYGSLLTSEAWQAVGSGRAASDGGLQRTLISILPLALVGLLVFFLWRRTSSMSGGLSGGSTSFNMIMPAQEGATRGGDAATSPVTSPSVAAVTLANVAGCDEAKVELNETIEFLKNPERFHKLGARIPRGVLLFGPPGTGKTMLAKAVANEAGVPFLHTSGSEFVEKFVGVGARRIRDLFAQARKLGRAVIFFDEFDAIAKSRGGPSSHEEREQTLNQLLVELDGFSTSEDVVVIAATNRVDILDHAVLRPGRFNRKIHVGLPDVVGRRAILAVHAANKPLSDEVDLDNVARRTYGFSGAMLADLLNEAAIMTARRSADVIAPVDVHGGWLKVAVGTSRRRSMDERERSIIAAHEVGHAICGKVHGDKNRVEEISLFAHGDALGVTVSSQEDNALPAESDLRARLVALMGGRAAEELLFHEVTGGAANDFETANEIATMMVTRWGMGRDPQDASRGISGRGSLSFLTVADGHRLPRDVEATATRAIRAILDDAYAAACETLVGEMAALRRIAAYLFEHERIDGETFEALFEGRLEATDADGEWRAGSSKPRQWGDIAGYLGERRAPTPIFPQPVALAATQGVPVEQNVATTPGAVNGTVGLPADARPGTIAAVAPGADPADGGPGAGAPSRARRMSRGRRLMRGIASGLVRHAEAWLRTPEEA
jgi:cell division protease FtsH